MTLVIAFENLKSLQKRLAFEFISKAIMFGQFLGGVIGLMAYCDRIGQSFGKYSDSEF